MTPSLPGVIAGIFGLGAQELMIVLLVVVVLFGAKKLPELARGMGKSIKEFKKATAEDADDDEDDEEEKTPRNGAGSAKKNNVASKN